MKWLTRTLVRAKKEKKGFTLIELMIVVIVVGILAAAAIPMYARAMDRAYASEGKALLGTVRTHYLIGTAEETLTDFTTLADWGIVTSTNRWWTTEGVANDFSAGLSGTVFTITGLVDPIDNIQLAIDCSSGVFEVEEYNYAAG